MFKKFLSRKFLLAIAVLVLAILQSVYPHALQFIDWKVVGVVLAYIFGEAGKDIIETYMNLKD